ncbi:hypothetical protein [Bosea sp. (in: a-proteobacteria)]|uniref:hypothetical protein n=1 Tax=Bosea sp. (in: a-proteobacteria) TaxID=1871050 RepID=UPI0027332B8E|nr:hypothetical protein [Bosea sp. (in: a-proteobacteria)]MDP3407092.1 hypothetical protein [Bosea sp. (in: a-proteobacteria)]
MSDFDIGAERLNGEPAAVIRAALARVLASDAFRAAPQLSAFLAFIVERAVAGRAAELKGYTIAVEAFGRSADFDPQSDPIVRVEAGRLRRALAQYYAGEGIADPVRMTIPVGAYVPAFEQLDMRAADASGWHSKASEVPAEPPHEAADGHSSSAVIAEPVVERRISRRWPILAGLALCIALLPLAAWYGGLFQRQTGMGMGVGVGVAALPASGSAAAGDATVPDARPLEPTVVALAIPEYPDDPKLAFLARRFSNFLVDALSRFDDLVTVKMPSAGQALPTEADYVFEMSGQVIEGTMESFGRLRSVRDGRIVWSASSTRPLRSEDPELAIVARRLATRLAEPFGIIHADIRQNPGPGPMPCIYRAIDFRRMMAQADHLAARTCLLALIRRDPTFYPAWAQLSFLSLFEYNFGFNALPEPPLERALSEALTAVRLAPSSARAQQVLMIALFARGATEEALKAGRQAMARNPNDSDVIATLGARYIQLNRPAEGLPLVEKAIEVSIGRPPSYDFFAMLGAHLLGARKLARGYGEFLGVSSHPYALLGRALMAADKGAADDKAEALAGLRVHHPAFAADPRLWLQRRGFGNAVIDRMLSDLALAGH